MAAPAEPYYLALDQGGHSSRALVFSAEGVVLAHAQRAVATQYSQSTWVEQDADVLLDSLRAVISAVHSALGRHAKFVCSAGLATQRANCICWDRRDGRALSPALSWQDRRAHTWLEALALDDADLHARTGLRRSAHYGASKLRWCLEHLPAVRAAAAADQLVCGPLASFLLARLLREQPHLIDPANAARSLLWNLQARDWDDELLTRFGIARAQLPRCVDSQHDFGSLAFGDTEIPLQIVSGDQSAALYAGGMPRTDTLYINMGTGAFLQRLVARPWPLATGLLASVVYADAVRVDTVHEATVNGAGTAFDWAREQLGISDIDTQLAGWLNQDGEIPLFLNGVAGLGSPWWRVQFASRFIGTAAPWAQAVAVAESIVFMLLENIQLLQGSAAAQRIQISGGLAQLDGLCQRLADLSGLPVTRSSQTEATAAGIAWLLAARDTDGWPADAAAVLFQPQENPVFTARFEAWREAMQQALMR